MVALAGSLEHSERLYINHIVYIITPTKSCTVCSNATLPACNTHDQVFSKT
jgi:hypothetical protein